MSKNNLEPIAVVGIGAIMPGALSKDEFWKNITEGKNSIIEVPQDRWDYRLFYSEDRSAPDKTYTKIGGFITGFKFNSLKYRIPPSVAKQMDSIQHLALETASMALEDAGYDKKDFDRSRTAVIIANAMGGIKNEYSNTRIYKAFYYDMLRHSEHFAALPPAEQEAIIEDVEASVNAKFLPITEDSMPGELPNVISGRVANVFNLNGTSFSIDAACASSIAALDQAVNGLRVGNYDMALCGGVDQMMSPAAYIKFCKIGALSADGSFAFDARANGFVMAEGAGMVILKRLSDAERDGDKIYGVIRAIGASSDGKGKGITAPNPKGQKLAIENTFKQLDYTPGEVGLMEAHGTATKVGDATELAALDEVFKPYAPAGSIGLGSIKSQIGHAKAAAGIASVIKVMLALHHKVLPPSINFETPNPIVDWASTPFKVITQARPWETDKIRRANVSSFGFGGTNFHLAAEEYHPALSAKKAAPSAISENQENKTMAQTQNAAGKYELLVPMEKLQGDMLVFSGESKQDLFNELNQAVQSIQGDPLYLIKAAYKNHTASYKQYAVSINAESPAKLKEKIEFFIKTASSSDVWSEPSLYLKMKGIYPFYNHSEKPKVCFMFPGQGSQYVDMMKDLASKYKVVRDTFAEADVILKEIAGMTLTDVIWSKEGESKEEYKKREEGIKQTQITQPAILTANVAMMRLLYQFGIKPDVTMGHSLGEYGAAVAAGVLSFPDAIRAVTTRGTAMANIKVPDCGKMAAIAASVDKIEPELKKISGYVAVANKNCPTQTVIAGESKSVDDAVALFTSMGIQSVLVPVSHAFHSAIVRPASAVYREFLNGLTINAPKLPITSNVSADFYPSDPSKIRDMMVEQIMSSVEWIKQVELAYARGVRLFIEVGPKRVLSAFVTSTLSDKKDIRVLASNHPKRGGITEFNDLMANLVAAGIWIDWSKTDMNKEETIFNPAFVAAAGFKAPAQEASASVCACAAPAKNPCEVQVAISGIAAGTPGSWQKVFRDGNLDEILQGKNFIENISVSEQERQISKNIEYVVKSRVGNHRVEKLTDVSQSVKLAAKKGEFDLEKEFGVPAKWVKSMDPSFTLAIAAGILALKDAGIPLVLYYKPTTAGTYLPDRWGLPQSMIDDTGVIFTSAFPTVNSWAFEVSTKVADALIGKTKKEVRAFYEQIINSISDESLKAQIKAWFEEKFTEYEHHNARVFSQDFLLKAIPIAHSQFCQWIRARGPATHLSGACASTAQAISVAEDWIKLGRAKRVIIIAADDVTNNVIQEWILAGFLASGAVSREADVTKAALPFDRRRNGMIVGMGAAGLVVEAEEEIRKRGMTPLTRLLATEITNSAFHPTRIDVNHVAEVMDRMMSKAEKKYGLSRSDMSKEMVFISHETYTPARGGSASAEVFALKNTFKGDVENVIVSNTKGFTGHSMGAGLEDVIAVHSLNTGNVPPIANYKEPDPELAGINLSKGGHYNFKYALRLAAGFGSQLSMTLQEKTWSEGTPRIIDQAKYMNWLKEASNQEAPVLEVVNNTLRIKDNYQAGKKPALVMEASQAFVDKAAAGHLHTQAEQAPAAQPVAAPVAAQPAVAPAPAKKLDEATVTEEIVNLISEKTGYPKDMLELDLDMEADLGIDTVKQAELFAAMREMYNLPQAEGIQLKDYPTIRHCINYALSASNNAGNTSTAPAPIQTVQASAPVTPAVTPVTVQPAPAPAVQPAAVSTPAPVVTAPVQAPAAKGSSEPLDEATVTEEIVNLIAEKTGYPKDMLELDLDMEADLGIDTVKQAELFAAMREMYNLPQAEGIQLKDYPTIRHCINYALNASSGAAPVAAAAPVQTVQASAPVTPAVTPVTVQPAPAPAAQPVAAQPAVAPAPAKKLDEATVTEEIVNLIAEKTGYPKDMLELDLDMEADLGIDTVKQAELFAAMREMYNLPQAEGIQLKDYPTIRHCINYALNASKAPAAQPAVEAAPAAQQTAPVEQNAPAAQPAAEAAPAPVPAVTEPKQYEGEDSHNKKLRFIPTLVDAPLTSEANRRLSADRTVLIFSDSAALTRAYVDAFKALGVKTHIFTTLKTRSKNTTIVNWDSLEETTAALEQYAKENPGAVQGIVYLLPCSIKKFDKKINPHADLTKFLMPLFMACKVFVKDMSKRDDADTFLSVVFKVDGAFAYKTKEAISPTIGSVCGAANCLRKDFYQIGGVFSKIMDFEASAEPEYMAEKTIHELLKGDDRGMVSYYQGNRSTLFSVPRKLNMSRKHMDLTGKTVAFTGAGRGLGAILSQKLASQYKARVLILDIIELTDKTPYWATLNEAELKELKQKMWLDMKADTSVRATPVMLERAFGKVKDSITLYKNMQKIKALGGDVDYYQCDVTNGSMMKDVVTRIKAKYGKVDGLIHFAGFERSKLFTDKTTDEYYRTFDIKATSAAAFVALNFVKDTGFYAFASSIAGKYGNLGQSDYASANDFLAKLCISLHNQGQRAVSIDMSAYANVGMGVRPGVVEFLTSHGVKFVDPYDGMQIFLNEIVYGRVPEIVLTDDLGELDLDGQIRINDPFILEEETEEGGNTPSGGNGDDKGGASSSAPAEQPAQESVKQPEAETENFFLGEVKNLSAGKEIAAENTFNAEYPFLFDHAIEGTPYVPGVMGIETFMETASMLEGKTPQGLEDVHFYLPIKLLRRRPQSVRIKGVNEGGKVSMEIESDFINSKGVKMGNTRRHFTARVLEHFESKWNNYKNKFDFGTSGFAVTKEEIYSKFFHGPSFQVLGGILKIDENAVLGVYEKPSQVLFHDGPKHLLAYPMLIEACFQTCGYRDLAVENRMTLPDSIGKIYIHGKGEAPNKLYTLAVFTGKNIEGKSIYDGFVFDEKGKLWIELSDYQMIGQ